MNLYTVKFKYPNNDSEETFIADKSMRVDESIVFKNGDETVGWVNEKDVLSIRVQPSGPSAMTSGCSLRGDGTGDIYDEIDPNVDLSGGNVGDPD